MDIVASSTALVSDMVSDIFTVLFSGLGAVLPYLAGLVGIFFIVRYIYRKVGRPKG